jgi:hypothetical protein
MGEPWLVGVALVFAATVGLVVFGGAVPLHESKAASAQSASINWTKRRIINARLFTISDYTNTAIPAFTACGQPQPRRSNS